MSEELLVTHCAPTFASIKTGNLFPYSFSDKAKLKKEIIKFNSEYTSRGLCLIPVNVSENRALLLLFRPEHLQRDLENYKSDEILKSLGYTKGGYHKHISTLVKRFNSKSKFPHEVGLFIGYPPEDVEGFIKNEAKDCKYVGTWKVYGDVDKAKERFSKYKKCTETYKKLLSSGVKLSKLVV